MGLTADIYKSGGRSWSNGGISDHADEVTIVNANGPFDPDEKRPAVAIVHGNLAGTVKAIPVVPLESGGFRELRTDETKGIGPMMGGCYIATSDGRFSDLVESLLGHRFYGAIPLHDRYETKEEYDLLSS